MLHTRELARFPNGYHLELLLSSARDRRLPSVFFKGLSYVADIGVVYLNRQIGALQQVQNKAPLELR